MKRTKNHGLSILIIILMTTLTLGNSYGVSTEIKILNNSSSSLKIIIFDRNTDKKEEFEIETGQYHEILYSGMNTPKPPLNYIRKITIYNRDNVLLLIKLSNWNKIKYGI